MNKILRVYIFGFISLGCLLLFTNANAQNYEHWIEKGQYQKALLQLDAGLLPAPNDIRLNFYKGKVYAQPDPEIFQADSAYKYLGKCLDLFGILKDKDIREKLSKIPITPSVVRKEINTLLLNIYQQALSENKAQSYYSFLTKYPQSKFAKDAQENYDNLTFKAMTESRPGISEYEAYYLANPNCTCREAIGDSIIACLNRSSKRYDMEFFLKNFPDHERYIEIYYRLYDLYRKDGELLTLRKFYTIATGVPPNDQQKEDYELAHYAWTVGLTANNTSSSGCFTKSNNASSDNDELNRRLDREGAKTGDLQFSLMWNNYNDLDLHVEDPNGEDIYYSHRFSSSGGVLDVDMNVRYKTGKSSDKPVENIFWQFGSAPSGHYRVMVVHYLNHGQSGCKDPSDYMVRVRCNGQDTLISGSITYNELKPRKLVIEFDYAVPERFYPDINDTLIKQYDSYIKAAAPRELAWVAVLKLVNPYIKAQKWDAAIQKLGSYAKYFKADTAMMARIRNTDQLLRDDRFSVTRERLANINTNAEEYSPVLSADEQLLYFCGRDRTDNIGKEDIYVAKAKGENWESGHPLNFINTAAENEAPLSVSSDGNSILLFRNGDIYYASKTTTGWSQPVAFPAPVNTEYWEGDAMLTADGKAIIFVSNRPGGRNLHVEQSYYHGNVNYASDIYVCKRTGEGWGPAINIGRNINTPYCERSPYLHPDLKTLYFSSDGHYGLGDLDVFMVHRESDTSWTQWSKPVNMGRSINTADADWGYQISTSGNWAYFSAKDDNSVSKEDIFRFRLPDELRPQAVIALTGRLADQSGTSVSATLHWVNLTSGEEVGVAQSDPQTGYYYILLPSGSHYGYYAESGAFFSISDNLDLTAEKKYKVVNQNIELYQMDQLVASGEALRINNLFFDSDKSTLRQESFPELKRLAHIIISYPGIKVEIMGHTDDIGPDDYNLKLSEARAQAVLNYLVSQNVPASMLMAKGYGESKPIAPNINDKNRQMNRRVEFRFTK
jgi:outer membrane protein OmpA-like peptidoglycan-associated protein